MEQEAHEDACKMLDEGLDIPMICRITGLTEQEIRELADDSEV